MLLLPKHKNIQLEIIQGLLCEMYKTPENVASMQLA